MNPVKEFVRQQIIDFTYDLKDMVYLIHDRTGEFWLKYNDYGINQPHVFAIQYYL